MWVFSSKVAGDKHRPQHRSVDCNVIVAYNSIDECHYSVRSFTNSSAELASCGGGEVD